MGSPDDSAARVLSAIACGGLTVVEQPIASLVTGEVTMVGLDVVTPGSPPLDAEQTRTAARSLAMASALDAYLLEHAASLAASGAPAAVSITPESLVDPGLSARVEQLLLLEPRAGRLVAIGIDESAARANAAMVNEVVARLRAAGCPLILEDFGSASTGFGYLRRFPADAVKIAPALVEHVESDATAHSIIGGIVALSRSLDVDVIAPGVSEPEALSVLADLGVSAVQGPLVGTDGLVHDARDHLHVSG